jgi:hypothetical protein
LERNKLFVDVKLVVSEPKETVKDNMNAKEKRFTKKPNILILIHLIELRPLNNI